MGVQGRHGVPEGLVVHLDRPEVALERRGHGQHLEPVAARRLVVELVELVEHYGASRPTVRRGLRELQLRG
jgi:hypothetical protein